MSTSGLKTTKLYPLFTKKIKDKLKSGHYQEKKMNEVFGDIKFHVIITFDNIVDKTVFISENQNLEVINQFNIIPSMVTRLSLKEINKYQEDELVARIEEDQQLHLSLNDVIEMTHLRDYKLSQINYTGSGVNIGLVDTGIQTYYESFFESYIEEFEKKIKVSTIRKERTVNRRRDISHATLMASIICNKIRNKSDIRLGIAPDANIIDLPVSSEQDIVYMSHILNILDDILKQDLELDILLISFSTSEPSDGRDILCKACEVLIEKGIILVAPVGNEGPFPSSIGSPGASEKIISVGSLNKNGEISTFSGRGPTISGNEKPDLYLYGSKIIVPLLKDFSIKISGTSAAAAIATGVVALIKEYNSNYTTEDIKDILSDYFKGHERHKKEINAVELFKQLGMYSRRLIPYTYLTKRSFSVTLQIVFVFIVIFFYQIIIDLILFLYGL